VYPAISYEVQNALEHVEAPELECCVFRLIVRFVDVATSNVWTWTDDMTPMDDDYVMDTSVLDANAVIGTLAELFKKAQAKQPSAAYYRDLMRIWTRSQNTFGELLLLPKTCIIPRRVPKSGFV
jgi:hypothetical protein